MKPGRNQVSVKNLCKWRIGATSFVIPADLLSNVRTVAGLIDNVQLLFFESDTASRLAHPVDIHGLLQVAKEYDLTYTVHLPGDIRLGAQDFRIRDYGVDQVVRLVDRLESLDPRCYDLHLVREDGLPDSNWLDNLEESLGKLSRRLGSHSRLIGIENLNYPFGLVSPLADAHGFSRTLDMGHALRFQHDWEHLMHHVSDAPHIHYHGVIDGKDHLALSAAHDSITKKLWKELEKRDFRGVVTLEMYSLDYLEESLETINRIRSDMRKGDKMKEPHH